jgi:hypothetical protein
MRDARDGLGFVLFGNTQLTPRYSWRDLAQGTPLWLCDQRLPRVTPCFGLQLTQKDDEGGAVKTELLARRRAVPPRCANS